MRPRHPPPPKAIRLNKQRINLLVLTGLGLALRLIIAPNGGHPGDLPVLTQWGQTVIDHGLLATYPLTTANYPPLGLALIALAARLHQIITGGATLSYQGWWPLLLKLPSMVADVGIGWMMIYAFQQTGRAGQTLAPTVLLLMVFHPALIILSAWWGQFESVYMLFALAAVLTAYRGRGWWSGIWLGLGLMIKMQTLVMAPVVWLILIHHRDQVFRHAAGLSSTMAVIMLPFLLTGQAVLVVQRSVALIAGPGWLTVNALNVWYLLTGGAGNWQYNAPLLLPDTTPALFTLSYHTWGLMLLIIWTLLILYLAYRSRRPDAYLLAGVCLYLGVFLFPTQSHERYAFGAVILSAAAWVSSHTVTIAHHASSNSTRVDWRKAIFFGMISLLHTLNLLWANPVLASRLAEQVATGWVISLAFVLTTGYGLWILARPSRKKHAGSPDKS